MRNSIIKLTKGASAIGYGLVVGLISVVALGAITSVGQQGQALFSDVGGTLDDVVTENVSFPSPSASASASASPSPAAENVYWNCSSAANYLVFVDNYDSQAITSYATLVAACKHYGFFGLGSANTSTQTDNGWGISDNSDMLQGTHCHNCYWGDGGNPWWRQNGGNSPCTHVSGTAPKDALLAGAVVNSQDSDLNCSTFKQEVNGTTELTNVSSDATHPLYFNSYNNPQDEPVCTTRNRVPDAVNWTGTPDYILCASATSP